MPWNGCGQTGPRKSISKVSQKSKAIFFILILLLLLVVIGILVVLFNNQPLQRNVQIGKQSVYAPKKETLRTKRITTPLANTNSPKIWPKKNPNRKDGQWLHGEGPRSIATTNGIVVTYPHCPGIEMILPHKKFAAPFKNISDNEIARILSTRPGSTFIDVPLPRNFDEKFKASLNEDIIFNETDSEETVNLKQQIIEARKILVEAIKRGESPREILIEESKNLRRLMGIKDNYQKIIAEEIKAGASDQDISEIVDAANKLLEREGIKNKIPLPYPIKLRINRNNSLKK